MSEQALPVANTKAGSIAHEVSNAMVALHLEQFGRGPTSARTHMDQDQMLVRLHGGIVPAERALVELGEIGRVQEGRVFFQEATRDRFIEVVERIVGREVHAFASACDPRTEVIWEIFEFKPRDDAATAA